MEDPLHKQTQAPPAGATVAKAVAPSTAPAVRALNGGPPAQANQAPPSKPQPGAPKASIPGTVPKTPTPTIAKGPTPNTSNGKTPVPASGSAKAVQVQPKPAPTTAASAPAPATGFADKTEKYLADGTRIIAGVSTFLGTLDGLLGNKKPKEDAKPAAATAPAGNSKADAAKAPAPAAKPKPVPAPTPGANAKSATGKPAPKAVAGIRAQKPAAAQTQRPGVKGINGNLQTQTQAQIHAQTNQQVQTARGLGQGQAQAQYHIANSQQYQPQAPIHISHPNTQIHSQANMYNQDRVQDRGIAMNEQQYQYQYQPPNEAMSSNTLDVAGVIPVSQENSYWVGGDGLVVMEREQRPEVQVEYVGGVGVGQPGQGQGEDRDLTYVQYNGIENRGVSGFVHGDGDGDTGAVVVPGYMETRDVHEGIEVVAVGDDPLLRVGQGEGLGDSGIENGDGNVVVDTEITFTEVIDVDIDVAGGEYQPLAGEDDGTVAYAVLGDDNDNGADTGFHESETITLTQTQEFIGGGGEDDQQQMFHFGDNGVDTGFHESETITITQTQEFIGDGDDDVQLVEDDQQQVFQLDDNGAGADTDIYSSETITLTQDQEFITNSIDEVQLVQGEQNEQFTEVQTWQHGDGEETHDQHIDNGVDAGFHDSETMTLTETQDFVTGGGEEKVVQFTDQTQTWQDGNGKVVNAEIEYAHGEEEIHVETYELGETGQGDYDAGAGEGGDGVQVHGQGEGEGEGEGEGGDINGGYDGGEYGGQEYHGGGNEWTGDENGNDDNGDNGDGNDWDGNGDGDGDGDDGGYGGDDYDD